jgi:hypothetical protein
LELLELKINLILGTNNYRVHKTTQKVTQTPQEKDRTIIDGM